MAKEAENKTAGINALGAKAAYNLANITKTKPQYGALTPKWLTFDAQNLTGKVSALPTRDDIDYEVQENMIVEFYSR